MDLCGCMMWNELIDLPPDLVFTPVMVVEHYRVCCTQKSSYFCVLGWVECDQGVVKDLTGS